ncbi:redox-regulated ATPase YchF [Chloroflexota bacterium]
MSVGIGIIGLPKSGRTTVFNALTGAKADTGSYTLEAPHIGIAKIADPRLYTLVEMYKPKKTTPAELKYIDIGASLKKLTKDATISGEYLSQLSNSDALMNVARAFGDESVPHSEGSVDAERDIAAIDLELAYSDLAIIERRLLRIEVSLKSARVDERQQFQHEQALLLRIKDGLEKDIPIRRMELSAEENKTINGYCFLSAKPLLTLINIGEEQIVEAQSLEQKLQECFRGAGRGFITLCGRLEMELSRLDEATAMECRAEFGLLESGLDRTKKMSFDLLGLINFFTTGEDEVKAWPITGGTEALKAAGKIHSDIERGFIRAEVISYDDLIKYGSTAEGRKHGLLRLEGKQYTVKDGDIINFLFNV